MTRSARQSKILEIISKKEIETQSDLVQELLDLNYDITQATISRDIKELGLIKILTEEKKYKYALVESNQQKISDKFAGLYKESVISIEPAKNLVVIKTLSGVAGAVSHYVEQMNIQYIMATVYGDNAVMVVCKTDDDALLTYEKLILSL